MYIRQSLSRSLELYLGVTIYHNIFSPQYDRQQSPSVHPKIQWTLKMLVALEIICLRARKREKLIINLYSPYVSFTLHWILRYHKSFSIYVLFISVVIQNVNYRKKLLSIHVDADAISHMPSRGIHPWTLMWSEIKKSFAVERASKLTYQDRNNTNWYNRRIKGVIIVSSGDSLFRRLYCDTYL